MVLRSESRARTADLAFEQIDEPINVFVDIDAPRAKTERRAGACDLRHATTLLHADCMAHQQREQMTKQKGKRTCHRDRWLARNVKVGAEDFHVVTKNFLSDFLQSN